jgi:hypothetical protein
MRKLQVASMIIAFSFFLGGGCDFFKSSGPEGGVSPFVTDLRISRSSVPCGVDFQLRFQYNDPQNDVEIMRITFQHEDGFTFIREILFQTDGGIFLPEGTDPPEEDIYGGVLDLTVPGRATYTFNFECGIGLPTGAYLISVQLIDDNGHESSPREVGINLTSS